MEDIYCLLRKNKKSWEQVIRFNSAQVLSGHVWGGPYWFVYSGRKPFYSLGQKPYKGRTLKTLGDLTLPAFSCLKQDNKPYILASSLFM